MFIRVTVYDTEHDTAFYAYPSAGQIRRYGHGALLSRGWEMPRELPRRSFARMEHIAIAAYEAQHSGCLSSCTTRGDAHCRW